MTVETVDPMAPVTLATWGASDPDHVAVVEAMSGRSMTFAEMDEKSARLAAVLRAAGLQPGDRVAVLMDNRIETFLTDIACHRAELRYVPINWHLKAEEAAYVAQDSGAKALIATDTLVELASQFADKIAAPALKLMWGEPAPGFASVEEAIAGADPIDPGLEREGAVMLYSSGTTGKPKGILRPLPELPYGTPQLVHLALGGWAGFAPGKRYLCPAPLYHAAPLIWSMVALRAGVTVVLMERFDPEGALQAIEREKVTHGQFVPTHFIRMLKLPDDVRARYDVSTLTFAIHAAAPCPVEAKEQMIEWWGPVIHEYYAGSEGTGMTAIGPEEWLTKKGTVGKPLIGKLHILSEDGEPMPANEPGLIYFEPQDDSQKFAYHNDQKKTAEAINARGWATLGDIGYVDEDGYLFLTDRISNMIISGGVNIYPQEVENALAMHPAVHDLAVIGVPHPEMGEEVRAVVQPADPAAAGPDLAAELIAYCRDRIAHYKCPQQVDFVDVLPRLENGKLLKRELKRRYA